MNGSSKGYPGPLEASLLLKLNHHNTPQNHQTQTSFLSLPCKCIFKISIHSRIDWLFKQFLPRLSWIASEVIIPSNIRLPVLIFSSSIQALLLKPLAPHILNYKFWHLYVTCNWEMCQITDSEVEMYQQFNYLPSCKPSNRFYLFFFFFFGQLSCSFAYTTQQRLEF